MIPLTYNLRSLGQRKATTFATAVGVGLVVFVLAASMMLSAGIKKTMATSGQDDVAIVIRKGSGTEMASAIEQRKIALVTSRNEVKRNNNGEPLGVAELVIVILLQKSGTEFLSNVRVRGVTPNALSFRPGVQIVEGRAARPGTNEVIIGQSLKGRFVGMHVGDEFEVKKNFNVRVVGVFSAEGSSSESEIWGDVDTIRSSFGRNGYVSAVRVMLSSPARFDAYKRAIELDKQLDVEVERERVYYEKESEGTSIFVTAMGSVIAFFFALGAIIGAAITMHAAVANRQREIGTLRALGFSRFNIITSFLFESVVLALLGAALGLAGALCLGFVRFSMMNFQSWNEVVFHFTPTPSVLLSSALLGTVIGVAGGLFPALRASKVSPVTAMRA